MESAEDDPLLASANDELEARRQAGPHPPDFLSHLSPEARQELETRLKRKIDARLMPALIVMYMLNYIDR